MRQSLSDRANASSRPPESTTPHRRAAGRAVTSALVLSAVLVVAGIIDQLGPHSLTEHATAMYASYGKRPDPTLLYGLLYTVAVVGALLWLPVIRTVRSGSRLAPVLAVVVIAITAALAVLLFATREYGAPTFPPLWGVLAALPPAAGVLALVLLVRGRSGSASRAG